MARASRIERLPREVRELIGKLRRDGRRIDEIRAALLGRGVEIPRSTLGDHTKKLDVVLAQVQRGRELAEGLVAKLGDAPEHRMARLTVEMMSGLLQNLMVDEIEARAGGQAKLGPRETAWLAEAASKLAQAAHTDVKRELAIRREFAAEAAGKAEYVARGAGLTPALVDRFRAEILGLAAPETERTPDV